MKTAIEIINEKMNEGRNVFFSVNKTDAEGKTFDEIVDEKFDTLDTDLFRVEEVEVRHRFIEGVSITSDRPSTLEFTANEVSTIIIAADVEEFDDELCEVIQL